MKKENLLVSKKIVASAILIALGFSACGGDNKEQASLQQGGMALPIKAFEVKNEKAITQKEYPAIMKAYEEVEVMARVSGVLEKKFFNEGDHIQKGAKLYLIEDDTYLANLNQARANYTKAKKDYERAVALLESKSISNQSFDGYEFAYKDAESKLNNAQIEFDYTKVVAPISGITGIKQHNVGSLVGTSAQNSLLVTITQTNPIHAEFSLPQEDAAAYVSQIQKGDIEVFVKKNGKKYNGKIDFISPKLDLSTGTLLVRAKFENKSTDLLVGEFLEIGLDNIDLGNVFIIPENAILKTNKGTFVYVIDGNSIAKITPVVVGTLTKNGIAIKKGLKAGDKIIVGNIAKVRPETKVMVMPEKKEK